MSKVFKLQDLFEIRVLERAGPYLLAVRRRLYVVVLLFLDLHIIASNNVSCS